MINYNFINKLKKLPKVSQGPPGGPGGVGQDMDFTPDDDVEPIHHDLRFSRFLSPARGGLQQKVRHSLEPIPHGEVA